MANQMDSNSTLTFPLTKLPNIHPGKMTLDVFFKNMALNPNILKLDFVHNQPPMGITPSSLSSVIHTHHSLTNPSLLP
jgi:hypothetical protein